MSQQNFFVMCVVFVNLPEAPCYSNLSNVWVEREFSRIKCQAKTRCLSRKKGSPPAPVFFANGWGDSLDIIALTLASGQ